MELIRSKKRALLAVVIIVATAAGTQYRDEQDASTSHQSATQNTTKTAIVQTAGTEVEAADTKTAVAGDSDSRGHQPSKPMIWFLGSTLLGMVGLKRFGLS